LRNTKRPWVLGVSAFAIIIAVVASFSVVQARGTRAAAPQIAGVSTLQISSIGTGKFTPTALGADVYAAPELDTSNSGAEPAVAKGLPSGNINRSHSRSNGKGPSAAGALSSNAHLEVATSFDGLNFRQQRFANGGNQFSVEPPDQGLCVGNGFVMEAVNDVVNVYSPAGASLLGVTDLNSFYGYIPAIVRSTGTFGPELTDPSCYFDQPTQRWFMVVLTLDRVGTTSALSGKNHLDLAVSQTSSPLGSWTIYRIPVQNDGTGGTPNHHCDAGPCLGDYPHIGADANGFYITTNEYGFFSTGLGFHAAQIYALSKSALAANALSISVTDIDTIGAVAGNPGFTVWPATSPDSQYDTSQGGTEYFMSSDAAAEANGTGGSTDLIVWALTNTQSLNSTLALGLSNTILTVKQYVVPPKANQKVGNFPLGQCLNDSSIVTPSGTGCWRFFFTAGGPFSEVESHLDSNDTRMQQVVYASGKLWGALDTSLTVKGNNEAGIEWFIAQPSVSTGIVTASLVKQGYLGVANTNLTYPAIGVTSNGKGVMAFTLVGSKNYPSAGYALIDATSGVGPVHIAAAGLGPDDGFTSYKAFVGNPPRTRWGDYGAAVADGNSIWIASEYIGQTCTLTQYLTNTVASPLFSCNMTRASLGNWDTRISELAA
jgi:hypothetical protein